MIFYAIGIYLIGAIWAFFIGYHQCFEYKTSAKSYILIKNRTPNDALVQGIVHGVFSWLVIISFRLFKDE